MNTDATRDRVEAELTAPLQALGLDLEALELTPAGRRRVLRVAVDQDGGVTSDDLAEATKVVSDTLDSSDVMGEQSYTLEVTSRGVERPLTLPRHWRRNTDRLVTVTHGDDSQVTGRIVDSDDESAHLRVESGERQGETVEIVFADVRRALVQIEFNRKEAH